jgi:SAM-dependent methyltransferase
MTEEERAARWNRYYDRLATAPPRPTLMRALDLFERESIASEEMIAADLGCGVGADVRELLRRGWRVHAIDREPSAIERLVELTAPELRARLTTAIADFETMEVPPSTLINASYSLPFCPPQSFDRLWTAIVGALPRGGRFSGHIFGEHHTWAQSEVMTCHRREQLDLLFAGFELEHFVEVDEDGQTALGDPKHWHVYSVVARKTAGH